jgi:multidrug efflux pump
VVNVSELFIRRAVATTLLTIGVVLAGAFAFSKLPIAPLPQVDFPTISVQAQLPGASPDTVATSVAEPLERHLGQIADVSEMTSQSAVGSTRITLQFGLDRDIDGAARDVQAAINAARADLPTSLRSNPSYHKVNPADAPILILALTSETLTAGQLYDAASNVLEQNLSQIKGIGEVDVSGGTLPAVRVELNPGPLFNYGIGLEDVRAALASANANSPKGVIEDGDRRFQIYTNDQATKAAQYRNLVIAYRNGAAVRLQDVADVEDSVENVLNAGLANNKPAILVILYRQPDANIIEAVDQVKAALPTLQAALPAGVHILLTMDRSTTIRSSLSDTERTLFIAVGLVILVVFVFLRDLRATAIPTVAVPTSIIGTFGAMYLLGYSLDNLSLMALTISTGFVVDDAIVVLENVSRHLEEGKTRFQAALIGVREVGFTVFSISLSLIAVFLPILLMGGIVGRLFREFAVTLSMAVLISLVVSLTTTPMLCSRILRSVQPRAHGRMFNLVERVFEATLRAYDRSLRVALRHPLLVILVLASTVALNVYLYVIVPKGLFPEEDTGRLIGGIQADQSISFQAMKQKFVQLQEIVQADPAVDSVAGFTGGRAVNSGFVFIALKPLAERGVSADEVTARLRPKLARVAGARLFLAPVQDLRVGGRQSNALYQYTLEADDSALLYQWAPKLVAQLQKAPQLTDVNSDQQQRGLQIQLHIDRAAASRLGLTPEAVDQTLYDAFGQRQVSVIYNALNQYHVVMEVAPQYLQSPDTLKKLWVSTSGANPSGTEQTNAPTAAFTATGSGTTAEAQAAAIATSSASNLAINSIAASGHSSASAGASVSTQQETMVPLAAFSTYGPGYTPLSVNHQGGFVASTISFNLAPGASLSQAQTIVQQAMNDIRMPESIHGSFAGTAQTFQSSLASEPLLIAAAIAAVYIVLGVLYESYIHPITILSTLPSAGVGAVLALVVFHTEFSIIALIGVILLIGIVKKNAIMMIDFALSAEREGLTPDAAIHRACLLRFRPIMMTTFAALLSALPLAFGTGEGSELRHPLGISILGGLVVSQALTLYTTPVVYLYMDQFGRFVRRTWARFYLGRAAGASETG